VVVSKMEIASGDFEMKYNGKDYSVRDWRCNKADCFVPFSGNGQNICRSYELGRCPENPIVLNAIRKCQKLNSRKF